MRGRTSKPNPKRNGFSLLEVVMMVFVIGLLSSLVVAVFSDTVKSASNARLNSDLKVLNSAVLAYIQSNGDLSTAKTAEDAIAKLKLVASSTSANAFNGYRGGFLEAGVVPIYQSDDEAATDDPRILWDSASQRFSLVTTGAPGIKRFARDNDLASQVPITENREGVLSLAQEDSWIWDYTESAPTFGPGLTVVTTVPEANPAALPAALPPPPPPPAPTVIALADPVFSIPGGTLPITDYDLSLVLSNPNPAGSSEIFYRVDLGPWNSYSGALSIPPSSNVEAQAISLNTAYYSHSAISSATYESSGAILDPPVIVPDQPSFGLFSVSDVTVVLQDPNGPGDALLQYRVEGSPWMDYSAPFVLNEGLYPTGAAIEARAVSSGSPYLLPSSVVSEFISRDSLNVSGSTSGEFHDPLGPSALVSSLAPGDASSYFAWGDGNGLGRSQSWMEYSGGTFADIIDGARFNAGSLTYYNGTIKSGSGANTIDLDIFLDIDLNGTLFRPFFDFTFDLINTPNSSDEIASADYVFLDDARSSRTIVYNGNEFEFKLEFGETTSQGFSEFDKFHVIEKEQASVNLYGTFTLLGPVASTSTGDSLLGGTVIIEDPETGTSADPIYQKAGYVDPEQYAKNLVNLAEDARDFAKDFRDDAKTANEAAVKANNDIVGRISGGNYYDAFLLYLKAIENAATSETAALFAEARATEAEDYATDAQGVALIDPAAEDEALKVLDAAVDARLYADEARAYADGAAIAAAEAESRWNDVLTNAPTTNLDDFLAYLEDRANIEESAAKASSASAEDFSDDAIKAESDTASKIASGNYKDAEIKYLLAAPAALESETFATLSEEAAIRARALADEAVALDPAHSTTSKIVDLANDAEDFALTARAAADAARAAAINAQALWDDALANAITNDAENWADYLLYLADLERRAAQAAFEDAKDGRDDAVKASADAIKKVGEGKILEAEVLLDNCRVAMLFADEAAAFAEAAAVEARAYAVQAGIAAANDPAAQGAYEDALVEADDAETYASEARNFADEAAVALADAEAVMP